MILIKKESTPYQVAKSYYKNNFQLKYVSDFIRNKLPDNQPIIVLCIGTCHSKGDILGPMIGTLLSRNNFLNGDIYGTIDKPVHALNLKQTLKEINLLYRYPYIIAVDSSFGRKASVGMIYAENQPVYPGAALNRKLPAVGDIGITGVISDWNQKDFIVEQGVKSEEVMQMAKAMASCLFDALESKNIDEIS